MLLSFEHVSSLPHKKVSSNFGFPFLNEPIIILRNEVCVANGNHGHSAGWVTMKPSNLHFQSYMIECASSLAQEMEHPTDALLLPLVQLQNVAEMNHRSLSTVDNIVLDYTNGLDLEMKVQSFQAELVRWRNSLPLVCQQPSKSS
jgi:hypothetical protein